MILTPAIFLDRDNTLTIDEGYSFEIEKFQWVNGAANALNAFQKAGIPVFIVTNQGGIGRGLFSVDDMHLFHQYYLTYDYKHFFFRHYNHDQSYILSNLLYIFVQFDHL